MLERLGFGSLTGSGFPGEAGGTLPHWGRWRDVTQATLSYGYGLNVTALQLAQAYTILAADGISRPPVFSVSRAPSRPLRAAYASASSSGEKPR